MTKDDRRPTGEFGSSPLAIPSNDPRYVRLVQSGTLGIPKQRWDATAAPTSTDDVRFGYKEGSLWYDMTGNLLYYCTSNAKSAATWILIATHVAVTLAADADVLLGLTGQQLTFDTQLANLVLAGPSSGAAVDPTFRSLVDADIPAAITRDAEHGDFTPTGHSNLIEHGDIAPAEGFVRKTGAGAYTAHKSNLSATVNPAVTDDSAAGYSIGSVWINVTADVVWQCVDATNGAAVWKDLSTQGAGGGAPTDADYLVGTANPNLSAEIVVGTTPGGELGGTWASPTVDLVHSGSAHHARGHDHSVAEDTTALVPESLEVTGGPVAFRGDITPPTITAVLNHNYNPTGLSDAVVLRLSSDAATRIITGLAGGADGRVLILLNVGSFLITLSDEDVGSLAENRFSFIGNMQLNPDEGLSIVYDSTSLRWRLSEPQPLIIGTTSSIVEIATRSLNLVSQGANLVWAGPVSGANANPTFRALVAADIPVSTLFSRHTYVNVPDAAKGVTVAAGDAQGAILHSGPNAETADALEVDAETAPGASGLPVTWQYGDTNDLDTVVTWTTIATLTLSSEKSARTTTMTNASIPANRLIRVNYGTIVGSPADVTTTLHVKRQLVT